MPSLPRVLLLRLADTDYGMEGILHLPFSVSSPLLSLELPWRNNEPSYSCIPEGSYKCEWMHSPSRGWCYRVTEVPGREYILIHSANWAGDRKKGYKSDLRGCLAIGGKRGFYKGQKGLFVSRPSIEAFNNAMNKEPFILEIRNAYNPSVNPVQ